MNSETFRKLCPSHIKGLMFCPSALGALTQTVVKPLFLYHARRTGGMTFYSALFHAIYLSHSWMQVKIFFSLLVVMHHLDSTISSTTIFTLLLYFEILFPDCGRYICPVVCANKCSQPGLDLKNFSHYLKIVTEPLNSSVV